MMKTGIQILALSFVLYCSSILIKHPSQKIDEVKSFDWLVGNWVGNYSDNQVRENWQAVAKIYTGKGTIYNKGIETFTEDLILYQENNNWYYCPIINGKKIPFQITEQTEKGFIAINPQNEFPQIISYSIVKADSLIAFIAGFKDNVYAKAYFSYQK